MPWGSVAEEGSRRFTDIFTCYTDSGRRGVTMAAIGPAVADVRFIIDAAKGSMGLRITSLMTDIIVDPGETRISEEVAILGDAYEPAMAAVAGAIARTHGSRTARGPVTGWCSWYDLGPAISQKTMAATIGAFAAEQNRFPKPVILMDDGWQEAYGNWKANSKFPDGMKAVTTAISAAGGIPGVWLCPMRSSPQGAHPDGGTRDYLDVTDPAVQTFIRARSRLNLNV